MDTTTANTSETEHRPFVYYQQQLHLSKGNIISCNISLVKSFYYSAPKIFLLAGGKLPIPKHNTAGTYSLGTGTLESGCKMRSILKGLTRLLTLESVKMENINC